MSKIAGHIARRGAIGLAAVALVAAAVPTATSSVTAEAPEPTREETVIFDLSQGQVPDPELWNPYLPSARTDNGFVQALVEPLFLLNYETQEIEPWLATEMTPNETLDEWTMKLRPGVKWSD